MQYRDNFTPKEDMKFKKGDLVIAGCKPYRVDTGGKFGEFPCYTLIPASVPIGKETWEDLEYWSGDDVDLFQGTGKRIIIECSNVVLCLNGKSEFVTWRKDGYIPNSYNHGNYYGSDFNGAYKDFLRRVFGEHGIYFKSGFYIKDILKEYLKENK